MEACSHLPVYRDPGKESGSVVICAAGPSLLKEMEVIKSLYRAGVPVCAVKGVADVLIENGIIPKYAVFMDAHESQARFLKSPHPGIQYLMCTQTHPKVMGLLEGYNVLTWHGQCKAKAAELHPGALYLAGITTGMAAISLMTSMGYAPLHLFGFDCSYTDLTHVYDKTPDQTIDVTVGGRDFKTSLAMIDQHNALVGLIAQVRLDARVYGDGALYHSARMMVTATRPDDYVMLVDHPLDSPIIPNLQKEIA